jgi:hypothetical protein
MIDEAAQQSLAQATPLERGNGKLHGKEMEFTGELE